MKKRWDQFGALALHGADALACERISGYDIMINEKANVIVVTKFMSVL